MEKSKLLTREREQILARQSAQHKHKAVLELVKSNLGLVYCLANQFCRNRDDLDDLVQEGMVGLHLAAKKFRARETKFASFARHWILQKFFTYFHNSRTFIKYPRGYAEALKKVLDKRDKFIEKRGRTPTLAELHKLLPNFSQHKVLSILESLEKPVCLDQRIESNEDDMDTLHTVIEDPNAPSAAEVLSKYSEFRKLRGLLTLLTTRETTVLSMRFGLYDGRCYDLVQIGRVFQISRERVRQIEAKALSKLRKYYAQVEMNELTEEMKKALNSCLLGEKN